MKKFEKIKTEIKDLFLIKLLINDDERGFFYEGYNKKDFLDMGIEDNFVQDNYSSSKKGVLRGLHFQLENSQSKIIKVISGKILDVALDLRKESKTFGKYCIFEMKENDSQILYIPKNFAHGFLVLEENTQIMYKCSDFYNPQYESGIIWNDKDLNIDWNLKKYRINEEDIIISKKDKVLPSWKEVVKKLKR